MQGRTAILLVVLVVAGGALAPVAGADDHQGTDEDEPATETPAAAEGDGEQTTVVAEVDEQLRVTGYSYDDERNVFSVEVENVGEDRSRLTVTEVISARDSSSGTFGVEMVTVEPDEQLTIEVSAQRNDGTAAVMLVTQRSLRQGHGTFLQTGERGTTFFKTSASWDFVRLSGFGGAIGTMLLALLVGWHRIADSHDKVEVEV